MTTGRPSPRDRILEAATALLVERGPGAVTTRAVAEAAGVQPPAIYRLFTDKEGLLDAAAEEVMGRLVSAKQQGASTAAVDDVDPVDDLRQAWCAQVEFGLAHPALFRLLSDPERAAHSRATRLGRDVLAARVRRIAETGRLRVAEDRAVGMVQASGIGTIATLLSQAEGERDPGLAPQMLDTLLAEIVDGMPDAPSVTAPAVTSLAATLAHRAALSAGERALLREWVERAAD